MTADRAVENLEGALLKRATALADEYLTTAQQTKDRILQEGNERLKLREERETLSAKAHAERLFRRTSQANALRLRAQMDVLRWGLVHDVVRNLNQRLQDLSEDEPAYLPVLRSLLRQGAHAIGPSELVVEVYERDFARLHERPEVLAGEGSAKVSFELAVLDRDGIGGVLVRNKEATIRVDNTFEGRIQRLEDKLHQVILERMFPQITEAELFFRG